MNNKLVVAVIAALNVGVMAGCSSGGDKPAAQPVSLAAPVAAPADAAAASAAEAAAAAQQAPASAPVEAAAPVAPAAEPAKTTYVAPAAKPAPQFAKVIAVKNVTETVSTPREVCHDEQVEKQAPVKDENRIAGTLAGAAAGGVIGHQIGDGDGRKIAKAVGIIGGAIAGNQIQKKMQEADTVTETVKRCETVTDTSEKHVGYDVTYSYAGRTDVVRMQKKPGSTLPVKNGEVVAS